MVGVAVQCDRSSPKAASVLKGSAVKRMEEPGFCNLSLAVDCTLSLGSTTSRTDIPARLSRAGSPDQDLEWSLSVRSERADPPRLGSDHGQDLSWGGSCNRSDPDLSPEYYPQVNFLTFRSIWIRLDGEFIIMIIIINLVQREFVSSLRSTAQKVSRQEILCMVIVQNV